MTPLCEEGTRGAEREREGVMKEARKGMREALGMGNKGGTMNRKMEREIMKCGMSKMSAEGLL